MMMLALDNSWFEIGGFGFGLTSLIFLLVVLLYAPNTSTAKTTFAFVAYVLFLQFLGGVDVFKALLENPYMALVVLLTYVVFGVCWSIFRLRRHVREKMEALKKEFTGL